MYYATICQKRFIVYFRWLGHVLRWLTSELIKLYSELVVGRRNRGRSTLRIKNVCRYLKSLNVNTENQVELSKHDDNLLPKKGWKIEKSNTLCPLFCSINMFVFVFRVLYFVHDLFFRYNTHSWLAKTFQCCIYEKK